MTELHPFIPVGFAGKWYRNNNLHINNYQPKSEWFVSEKSFGYLPSNSVKCLFLGTFPTWEVVNQFRVGGNLEFFYGSADNNFWSILSLIAGITLNTESQIFSFLENQNLGISDILMKSDRIGRSSADSSLNPIVWNDLIALKKQFNNISTIICTSGGASKITRFSNKPNGETNLNTAIGVIQMLRNSGFNISGFNTTGYKKHIDVMDGNTLIWRFDLINLLSPSENATRACIRIYNGNTTLQRLVQEMPLPFDAQSIGIKVRILQWAYFLSENCMQLDPILKDFLNSNSKDISSCFYLL